jgi:tetratricopeptide (TPR) repeat protein
MKVITPPAGRCHWRVALLLQALLLHVPVPGIAAQCHIQRLEVPITMNGLRPTLTAQINGVNALFTLDSGAFWSVITPAAAEEYHLHLDSTRLPPGYQLIGINGRVAVKVATVATFTLFNHPFHAFDFLVGGTEPGAGTIGVLGQNILRAADIEYDLAQGAVRFLKTTDCTKDALAYWVKPGESYSLMDIQTATAQEPHTIGTAYLNGSRIRVTFDTGASVSIVGLRAASKAGIQPGGPGVEEVAVATGFGRNRIKTWIATFPSLKIADEEIHNARLRFGDIGDLDMLLGADFFLSHRVFVASSQSKLYFTYNGGPVFNYAAAVAREKAAAATPETPEPSADTAADGATSSALATEPSSPADAPAIARRAAAYAARRDFEHALQDYNRACELAPGEASYFYQRGLTQFSLRRNEAGAADIETAIKLNPGYVDALLVRAEMNLRKHATADAVRDLDSVDRLVPKEAAIRYRLAGLYTVANELQASIGQLDLWIAHHAQDAGLPAALNDRCWNRAVLNQDLDQALDDCTRALRLQRDSEPLLDSRGFVHLRRKEFDKAIADYDAVLEANPKAAWSLYCRGIAKSRAGKVADGASDMSAAVARNPRVAERAKRYGID